MKNLLVIAGDYFPHPSSNTNCFEPLLYGLEKDGWHIDIVTLRQWPELSNHEVETSGRDVWRIDDARSMNTIIQNSLQRVPAPPFLKAVNKCFSTMSKGVFGLKYGLAFKPRGARRFASWPKLATVNKCIELHKIKNYNLVLSFSHPVECHEVAKQFCSSLKGDAPPWILYEFDPYCYNEHIYGKNCYNKLFSKQQVLFDSADKICLIPELYNFYKKTPFCSYM